MNGARRAHRVRVIALFILVSVLALGSFWLLEVMRRSMVDNVPDVRRVEPDYYVEKFSFVRIAMNGQARYNMSGARLVHYPEQDAFEIQQPVMHSLSDVRPPLTMLAERAVVADENSKVHMYKNVQMDRPASGASEHFHLKSEYLLILPDDDVMQTDKPVEIVLGTSKLTGTGMLANNATRQFHLSNNVRGSYPSPVPAIVH